MRLPALLTVAAEYRPRSPPAAGMKEVRANSYRGKVYQPFKWTAEDIGADPKKIGLVNSPTIVGTGIDIGKPPVQKSVGSTQVFLKAVEKTEFEGKAYGPYSRGDVAADVPEGLVARLRADGSVGVFDVPMLAEELTA